MELKKLVRSWQLIGGNVYAQLTGGLFFAAAKRGILSTVTYSATPTLDASLANDFVVTITDGVAFVVAVPLNPPATGLSQDISITFRNASGGAHGAGTWNAVFKTQATVFAAIANGFSRTIFFRWNGTNWVELVRTAADVAN
jgi:hypothetical protein